MNKQKHIVQTVAYYILRFSLYSLAIVMALYLVFSSSSGPKQEFIKANAYNRFVSAIIEQAIKTNQNTGSLALQDPQVQQIIKSNFPPEKLQQESEKVINSIYLWLNNQTTKPDFIVDFTPNVDKMAEDLSSFAVARLASLPVCDFYPVTVDPFKATCRPQIFDYKTEQKILADNIRTNNGIFTKTKFTEADLPKTSQGTSLFDQYAYAPRIFSLFQALPWVLICTSIISVIIIIGTARRRREDTKRVGMIGLSAGIFIVLSPLFYIYVLPKFFPGLSGNSSGVGPSVVIGDVINMVNNDFIYRLLICGGIIGIIGLIVLVLERATRPKSKYIQASSRAGLKSSEKPHKNKKGKTSLSAENVPLQTSEGKKLSGKYQKDKKYRKIPKKEYK